MDSARTGRLGEEPVWRNPRFSSPGLWCCPLWLKYLLQPSVMSCFPLWLCVVFTAYMFGPTPYWLNEGNTACVPKIRNEVINKLFSNSFLKNLLKFLPVPLLCRDCYGQIHAACVKWPWPVWRISLGFLTCLRCCLLWMEQLLQPSVRSCSPCGYV